MKVRNWIVEGRDECGERFTEAYYYQANAQERVAEIERNGGRARYYDKRES